MAKGRGWIWISLALVCAISAGGLTFFLLQRQSQAQQAAIEAAREEASAGLAPVEMVTLPVAARDLPRETVITAADLLPRDFPANVAPPSAIADSESLVGRMLSGDLLAGDPIFAGLLYGGEQGALSAEIEPGKTVIAFPILDLFAGTGLFVENDRVDLLLSFEQPEGGPLTGYTVQNVRLLRILAPPPTEDDPTPSPTALLFELDPAAALMVKRVKDAGGTIDMALRSPLDEAPFVVDPLTNDDLIRLMQGTPENVGQQP